MDQKTTRKLENELVKAFVEVIVEKFGLRRLPLLPSHHTMQLMARAAIAVYEAAVEKEDRQETDGT